MLTEHMKWIIYKAGAQIDGGSTLDDGVVAAILSYAGITAGTLDTLAKMEAQEIYQMGLYGLPLEDSPLTTRKEPCTAPISISTY